jgi:thioester reductase-like protein
VAGVLLTGATGLVGQAMLGRLLAHDPEATVYCLVRADDHLVLRQRRDALLGVAKVAPADVARVVVVAGDVERPGLGLVDAADLAARVDVVVHAAANTRFDLSIDAARTVNVGAARNVVEFALLADRVGGCRRLHHVSTAYVAGAAAGVIANPPLEPLGGFRNTYEQSKWEAELVVRDAGDHLRTTISRPSIIVGDSHTGATPHFRVLYEPMKWIYFNSRSDGAAYSNKLTNVLPCRPDVRLDVVPVDYVADAIVALTHADAAAGGVFHISAGAERALSIEETVDVMLDAGNEILTRDGQSPIERPTIVSPEMLAESDELREIFELGEELMSAYMPYALQEQLFEPTATHDVLGAALAPCPHPRAYYPAIVEYAIANDYGRTAREV